MSGWIGKRKNCKSVSRFQARVIGNREKAMIFFYHEKLSDNGQREEMKRHWNKKMDEIEKELDKCNKRE